MFKNRALHQCRGPGGTSYTQSVLETVFLQGKFGERLFSVSVTAIPFKYYFTTPKLIRALTHIMYLGEDTALTKVSK